MTDRVTLYTRPGCHLCDEARTVVTRVCDDAGVTWREVDIDAPGHEELRARFGDLVPVVEVDGTQVGYWRIKAVNVRMALVLNGGQ